MTGGIQVIPEDFNLTVSGGVTSVSSLDHIIFEGLDVVDTGGGTVTVTATIPPPPPVVTPGGNTGELQYNNVGVFGGATGVTYSAIGTHLTVTAQAATDTPVTLRPHASQTAPLLRATNAAGSTSQEHAFEITKDRDVNIPDGVGKGIYWWKDNTGQPSIKSAGNGILEIRANASSTLPSIQLSAFDFIYNSDPFDLGANYQYLLTCGSTPAGVAQFALRQRGGGMSHNRFLIAPDWSHNYWNASSSAAARQQFRLTPGWADNTDATRKARVVLDVYDTDAREWMRFEADGTGAMGSFYGVPAVARQLVPTGSSNDDVIIALQNLGLFRQS